MIITDRHKQLAKDIQSVRTMIAWKGLMGLDCREELETIYNLRKMQADILKAAGYKHARVPVGNDLRNIPETVTRK